MADLICAALTGCLSAAMYLYVFFTARGKGPILSNTYLFASKQERERLDRKAEYRLVTIVFSFLGTVFASLTAFILTEHSVFLFLALALVVCVVIYAIRETAKTLESEKKER